MNKFDTQHAVTGHPKMSIEELQETYRAAWSWYYTPEHMETVMRRAAACGVSAGKTMFTMLWFFFSIRYAKVHPLEGGYFRRRVRRDRRPEMKRESPLVFYPRHLWEIVNHHFWMGYWLVRMGRVRRQIRSDKDAASAYTDLALTPPAMEEFDDLALFAETRGGAEAVNKRQREDAARDTAQSTTKPAVQSAAE